MKPGFMTIIIIIKDGGLENRFYPNLTARYQNN